jgi:DNA-binding MarR family transcriptional regulator
MDQKTLCLDAFIPYRLSYTSNLVSHSIADTYEALFGITITEWRVLAWAAAEEGITQQEIGTRTRMDKVSVSRAAIALTDRQLLNRRPNPEDRRSHLLVLSAKGQSLYAAIAPKALELERRIFAGFEPQEINGFVDMLRRIDRIVLGITEGGAGSIK